MRLNIFLFSTVGKLGFSQTIKRIICPAILILNFLLWGTPGNCADRPGARRLYIESIIYRSKTEGTDKYMRKFRVLSAAGIERWYKSVIDDEMERIDQGPNTQNPLIDWLGLFPGYVGKGAKGLKIYDMANKAYNRRKGGGSSEDDFRQFMEFVLDRAAKDPAYAAVIDDYMSKSFGKINGTVEQILSAYPAFSDHLDVQTLKKLAKNQELTSQETKELIDDLKENFDRYIKEQMERQAAEGQYQAAIGKIEEISTYGTLVGRLIGLKNPNLGGQIVLAASTFQKAAEIMTMAKFGKISGGLATANLIMLSLDVFSSLAGGPSPEQMILQALADLQELIIDIAKQIMERLDFIDEKLNEILRTLNATYVEVLKNQEAIASLHQKVDDLSKKLLLSDILLFNAIKAGFERNFINLITTALTYKEVFKPGKFKLSQDDFNRYLLELFTYATVHSKDALALPLDGRALNAASISTELSKFPLSSNLAYIHYMLSHEGNVTLPAVSADAETWSLATVALLELLSDWPEYQSSVRPDFLEDVSVPGNEIKNFLIACRYDTSKQMYENLISSAAKKQLEYATKVIERSKSNLQQDISRNGRIIGQIHIDSLKTVTAQNFDNLFQDFVFDKFKVEAHIKNGTAAGKSTLDLSQPLTAKLPPFIKLLYHLNVIDFVSEYDRYEHSEGRQTPDGSKTFVTKQRNFTIKIKPKNDPDISLTVLRIKLDTVIVYNGFMFAVVVGNITPQQLFNNEMPGDWIPSLMQPNDMDSIKKYFLPVVESYFNQIFSNSLTEEYTMFTGKQSSDESNGIFELLLTGLYLGHPEKMFEANEFEKTVADPLFLRPDGSLPDIISKMSFNKYVTEFSKIIGTLRANLRASFVNKKVTTDFPILGEGIFKELQRARNCFKRNVPYKSTYAESRDLVTKPIVKKP